MSSKDVNLYYHVCLLNNGLSIVQEQLYLLHMSGLLSKCKSLNIGVLYENLHDYLALTKIISYYDLDNKVNILFCKHNDGSWEQDTAIEFKKYADQCDEVEYVLYFHNKGTTHHNKPTEISTRYWRHYLEYFNILKWEDCVSKLNEGYDSCGTQWLPGFYSNHYSGTFFWMTTSLIKQIDVSYFSNSSQFGRFCIEALPGAVEHKAFSFHTINENLYDTIIKPEKYR